MLNREMPPLDMNDGITPAHRSLYQKKFLLFSSPYERNHTNWITMRKYPEKIGNKCPTRLIYYFLHTIITYINTLPILIRYS